MANKNTKYTLRPNKIIWVGSRRFRNVKLKNNLECRNSLLAAFGVNRSKMNFITSRCGIAHPNKFGNLPYSQQGALFFFLNKALKGRSKIKYLVATKIKKLISSYTYRGGRHLSQLPVRGQRTRTNAKSRTKSRRSGGNAT